MKKAIVLLIGITLTFVFYGNAIAASTHIVYELGNSNCTVGDYYYNTVQDAVNASQAGDTIYLCPGEYEENIYIMNSLKNSKFGLQIKAYDSNQGATIRALDPNQHTIYIHGGGSNGVSIRYLTITGATGGSADIAPPSPDSTYCKICPPGKACVFDSQPHCAGIRAFCSASGWIGNSHITENNHGIIVKDTAEDWVFFYTLIWSTVDKNSVGVKLQFGSKSYLWDNTISENGIGIHLIDTWDNLIDGNTITADNDISIKLERDQKDVNSNFIIRNKIYDPVIVDNTDCPDHWYKRITVSPSLYYENECYGTADMSNSSCSYDDVCNPIP